MHNSHVYDSHVYDAHLCMIHILLIEIYKKVIKLSVFCFQGYKVLIRYEGFANDGSHDFWTNFCGKYVHPVGYCARMGKPLIPPNSKWI